MASQVKNLSFIVIRNVWEVKKEAENLKTSQIKSYIVYGFLKWSTHDFVQSNVLGQLSESEMFLIIKKKNFWSEKNITKI